MSSKILLATTCNVWIMEGLKQNDNEEMIMNELIAARGKVTLTARSNGAYVVTVYSEQHKPNHYRGYNEREMRRLFAKESANQNKS